MRPLRLLLALLPVLAGCSLTGDCSFDTSTERYDGRTLQADVPATDTLTVAFVQTYAYDVFRVFVRPGADEAPDTLSSDQLFVVYDAFDRAFGESDPAFETAVRGDTLFVRPEPGPEGGLVRPACSPPLTQLDVYVNGVYAPPGVRHVRFVTLDVYEGPGTFPVGVAPRPPARPPLTA